jgi:hypothetical protein
MFSTKEITAAAWAAFASWLLIAISQVTPVHTFSRFGLDFIQFYGAGQILNEHENLYDIARLDQLRQQYCPIATCDPLWFGYSPSIGLLFRPFALLHYPAAFALWLLVSLGLYSLGLYALRPFIPVQHQNALYVCALSFAPFALKTWNTGQISTIAFVLMAWAIRCDLAGKPFATGALLALCSYKPTMLLIIGPCLLIRCNWRILAGFTGSFGTMIGITIATLGVQPYLEWIKMLVWYSHNVNNISSHLINISAFLQHIVGPGGRVVFLVIAIPGTLFLLSKWRQFDSRDLASKRAYWALAISATLLFGIYVQMYDGILTALAFLIVYRPSLNFTGGLLYGASLLSAPVAIHTRVEPFTIAVAYFVWLTLREDDPLLWSRLSLRRLSVLNGLRLGSVKSYRAPQV